MEQKKLFSKGFIFIIGILLLVIPGYLFQAEQEARALLSARTLIYEIGIFISFFLLGILIEWKTIKNSISQGFNINILLLIFASILLLVALIPLEIYFIKLGINNILTVLLTSHTRTALSMLSGILVVRSLN